MYVCCGNSYTVGFCLWWLGSGLMFVGGVGVLCSFLYSINQPINQSEGICIAPKSTKIVQRRSRQLDEINLDRPTLVGIYNILRSFLKISILDVVRESVPYFWSKTGE